jgi:hypothetical protein
LHYPATNKKKRREYNFINKKILLDKPYSHSHKKTQSKAASKPSLDRVFGCQEFRHHACWIQ